MTFTFSGNMKRFVDFEDEVSVEGLSVEQGLQGLIEKYPALRTVLFDGEGKLRAVHRLFLNGDLLQRDEITRAAAGTDEIAVLTPIAGG